MTRNLKKLNLNRNFIECLAATLTLLPMDVWAFSDAIVGKVNEGRDHAVSITKAICMLGIVICLGKIIWDKFHGNNPNWALLSGLMIVAFAITGLLEIFGFLGLM